MDYLRRAERKLVKKLVFDTCPRGSSRDLKTLRLLNSSRFATQAFRRRLASYLGHFAPEKRYSIALCDGFTLEVSARDSLQCRIAFYGSKFKFVWEPKTAQLLAKLLANGGNAIIAGGHIGYFPLLASTALGGKSGNVFTFEPNEDQRTQLIENVTLNGRSNIIVEPYALHKESGVLRFYKNPSNLKSAVAHATECETIPVQGTFIDGYLASRGVKDLAVIMLDVEGAEFDALLGAKELLEQGAERATDIIFELVPGRCPSGEQQALMDYLMSSGYELFVIEDSYDYSIHKPVLDDHVRLHHVKTLDQVASFQKTLGLPDPNVYATKRSGRWTSEAQGILVA